MKAVVVFSGGLDSTVLLFKAVRDFSEVVALTVDYGQRHDREILSAMRIAKKAGVRHLVLSLKHLADVMKGSSQTDPSIAVPHGHYEEETMKATVVPNRNMVLLSVATAAAISEGSSLVLYGAHAGDHAIYPDCRPEFIEAMSRAVALCDWSPPTLAAPFRQMTKADIVALGVSLGAPLGESWSCYEGGDLHCGKCGTCVERREAFHLAGFHDVTEYRKEGSTCSPS